MDNKDTLDFNFWPSFSDMMLILVLILVVILFSVGVLMNKGNWDLKQADDHKMEIIEALAGKFEADMNHIDADTFGISTRKDGIYDIEIHNGPTFQKITFSDHILFPVNSYRLNARGREILFLVADILRNSSVSIKEIQIQGHADIRQTRLYESNLDLAARRAMQVFYFFQNSCGIDPIKYLMSATSFGEFKPVNRKDIEDDSTYSIDRLVQDNSTDSKMDKNRRIELLLFYKYKSIS